MQSPSVLVVDDSSEIRAILRYGLTERGYDVLEATDGHEAIRIARQARPDVILLDLSLPALDGWETARRIRAEPALDAIIMIAVTAYSFGSAVQTAIDAGFHDVVAKPFEIKKLMDLVATLLYTRAGEQDSRYVGEERALCRAA